MIKWLICAVHSVPYRAKPLGRQRTFVCLSGYKNLLPPANQTRHVLLSIRYDHWFFSLHLKYEIMSFFAPILHSSIVSYFRTFAKQFLVNRMQVDTERSNYKSRNATQTKRT
jgi:hypothetical protein